MPSAYQTARRSNQACNTNNLLILYNLFSVIDDHRISTCDHDKRRTVDHRSEIREVNYCGVIDMRVISRTQIKFKLKLKNKTNVALFLIHFSKQILIFYSFIVFIFSFKFYLSD